MALFSKNKDNNKASAEDAQASGKKATSGPCATQEKRALQGAGQARAQREDGQGCQVRARGHRLRGHAAHGHGDGVLGRAQPGELRRDSYHLTGGVAAEVNGINITEDTVTKQIMSTRESGRLRHRRGLGHLPEQPGPDARDACGVDHRQPRAPVPPHSRHPGLRHCRHGRRGRR